MSGNSEKTRLIYGEEAGCDVIFTVGPEGEAWRLPAHIFILRRENCVFNTMLSKPYVQELPHEENVPDVDGRAFDNLLKCLYNVPLSLQTVENALTTLHAAHKYRCQKLVKICVDFLLENMSENNVLRILYWAQFFSGEYRDLKVMLIPDTQKQKKIDIALDESKLTGIPTPSAPTLWELKMPVKEIPPETFYPEIEGQCWHLLQDCLAFVDKNAVVILASDEFEDLDLPTMRRILSGDTLDVPNETVVLQSLQKWVDKECKRKHLPLTSASKRNVLKESIFLPRYLSMNMSEFQSGPLLSELLTPEEIQILTKLIKIKTGTPQNINWTDLLSDFPTLRPFLYDGPRRPIRKNIVLQPAESKRKRFRIFKRFKGNRFCCRKSEIITTPVSSTYSSPTHRTNLNVRLNRRESQSERLSRFNFIENIFICLACLFD